MRFSYVVLLTVPAAALGAGISQARIQLPVPMTDSAPVPVAPAVAEAVDASAPLLVRGGQSLARTQMFASALADTGAEVLLGDASCTEDVVETTSRSARFASGSRRDENPSYRSLLDQQEAR